MPHSRSRYRLLTKIASGGMGSVYVGCAEGPSGFRRLVAIKRAHPHLLEDPVSARMLVAEARVAARAHHPNVVAVLDVEERDNELFLIMDYIEGVTLAEILRAEPRTSLPITLRILQDAVDGLDAVHHVTDDTGKLLNLVHRDVSPQNVIVGADGLARITDFGVARTSQSESMTTTGMVRGKPAYLAPEYLETGEVSVGTDVFALGVVAWEALTRTRLFRGNNDIDTMHRVLSLEVKPVHLLNPLVPPELSTVIQEALHRDPRRRYASARAFSDALYRAAGHLMAERKDVADFVRLAFGDSLSARRATVTHALANDGADEEETHANTPTTHAIPSPAASSTTRRVTPWTAVVAAVATLLACVGIASGMVLSQRQAPPPLAAATSAGSTAFTEPVSTVRPVAPTESTPPPPAFTIELDRASPARPAIKLPTVSAPMRDERNAQATPSATAVTTVPENRPVVPTAQATASSDGPPALTAPPNPY